MNLTFIEKLIDVGISCSTRNSENLISKEGLIAIIKDSCERNGVDSVLSVLTNGIDYINVDRDVLKKYFESYYSNSKEHNIVEISINYVSRSINGRTNYKRRYYANANDQIDTRWKKDDNHTVEIWSDDVDRFDVSFDDYYNAVKNYATPVEETTD